MRPTRPAGDSGRPSRWRRRPALGAMTLVGLVLAGCSGDAQRTARPDPASSVGTSTPSAYIAPPPENATGRSTERGASRPRTPQQQERLDARLRDAAWEDDVGRARRLIRRGADVNAKDGTEQNAYLIATSEGYYELLELTLRHGADVDAKDSYNGTGIIRAAERGHWRIVGRLVTEGIPVDHVNNLGWTGLHEAIILGDGSQRYVDTVRVLVAAGANVTLPSARDGVTPIAHARARAYTSIADLLEAAVRIDDDPPPTERRMAQRLLAAAATGDADEAALALRAGAGLEARDAQRRTALLHAAASNHLEVARVLVALGANPDALDVQHDTPWLVTGVTGSVPMARLLLTARPDLSIRNRFGGVSVIPASERGHHDYVRWVVRRTDIDVNHVNDLGWTALLEAVILGDGSRPYQQIVRILLAGGADPAVADSDGVTALEHAEASGQTEVAQLLRTGS